MALIATLRDDFNDNSINTGLWTAAANGTGGTVQETGQALVLTPDTGGSATPQYLVSNSSYDLTGSSAYAKVVSTQSLLVDAYTCLRLGDVAAMTNCFYFHIGNTGGLFDQLSCRYKVAGVGNVITNVTYSATNHKWLRIRESGGTIYYDTSADGITWVHPDALADGSTVWKTAASNVPAITLTAVLLRLDCGTNAATSAAGAATWDNVNTLGYPFPPFPQPQRILVRG